MPYIPGDWWMICDRCGFKFRRSQMRKTWEGLWTCTSCWEPKHPQLSVKAKRDKQSVPVARPDIDVSIPTTTVKTDASKDATSISLTSVSYVNDSISIGITLNDGTVQWVNVTDDPTGSAVPIGVSLWAAADEGNTVYVAANTGDYFVSDNEVSY